MVRLFDRFTSHVAECIQDLAVVVLLMLIPLLAPTESGAPAGLKTIAQALGIAALKVSSHHTYELLWQYSCNSLTGSPFALAGAKESMCLDRPDGLVLFPLLLVCKVGFVIIALVAGLPKSSHHLAY